MRFEVFFEAIVVYIHIIELDNYRPPVPELRYIGILLGTNAPTNRQNHLYMRIT